MAETVLRFGPEWLRALSECGPNHQSTSISSNSTSFTPGKYKLADYRYGREEMLLLFDADVKMAPGLREFSGLITEKCQLPLALLPMPEEEQRLWTRPVNSEAMLRLSKTGPSGSERDRNERGLLDRSSGPRVRLASDRVRGRGRTPYYQRGISYDEDPDLGDPREYRKGYDRNQNENSARDKCFDRPFSKCDNSEEAIRRKDCRSLDNWRSGGRNEDRDRNWRSRGRADETWGRDSWRSEDKERENEEICQRNGPLPNRNYTHRYRSKLSESWDSTEDEAERRCSLPEWSLDDGPNLEAKVGTFDASGAFREETSEEDVRDREIKNVSEACEQSGNRKDSIEPSSPNRFDCVNNDNKLNRTEDVEHLKNDAISEEKSQSSSPKINEPVPDYFDSNRIEKQNHSLKHLGQDNSRVPNVWSEDDGLSHIEIAAEMMVARWSEEEDQKESQSDNPVKIMNSCQQEDANKWYYRDPQGRIQGPFLPQEMFEWFTAGYFTMDLLVRRGCDERFSQLGELLSTWGVMPFVQNESSSQMINTLAPSQLNSDPIPPSTLSTNAAYHLRQQQFLQQHQHQEQIQRQLFMNPQMKLQTRLKQLLEQLKKQEGFSNLSQQEQQEVLVQHYVNNQQMEQRRANHIPISEEPKSVMEQLARLGMPMVRNSPLSTNLPSIWDLNGTVMTASALEEMQRQKREKIEAEEKKKLLEINEQMQKAQEEEKRLREEMQRKINEDRRKEEMLREEERRKKEAEEEERRLEHELKIEKEKRIFEEQRRRQEERIRLEEIVRQKIQEEERKQRQREAEEAERLRNQQLQHELEFRQRHLEKENYRKQQEQEEAYRRMQEQKKVWDQTFSKTNTSTISLAEIQRLQEEKEREKRMKQRESERPIAQESQQVHQLNTKQIKNQLTWANSNCAQSQGPVKTLAEIQIEEAEELMKRKQQEEKKMRQQGIANNAGIWMNAASQLSWKAPAAWNNGNNNPGSGYSNITGDGVWDNEAANGAKNASSVKSESALQQHSNKANYSNTGSNNVKSQPSTRAKKEEEVVMKLFERRQKADEFTQWGIEALAKFNSSIDAPTFVAFLKDVESPYDISDYVKSYLGDNKETKEFVKQFLEKRSYYRNQAKKDAKEELMWGPAPAINPSINKSTHKSTSTAGDGEPVGSVKTGKKKKRAKRVDSSILGFTVQADPERINAGEIEQAEK